MEILLTAPEAATFMRSSIYTIRAWTNQRRIPVVKAGRKCLYRRGDLEKFLDKGYRPAKD
jgi:excisionase family DNA binding protein